MNGFNLRTRYNIDVLADEFLRKSKDDIHDMLCDNCLENYRGLDSSRDTEKEVETAIRFFPEVLSTTKVLESNNDDLDPKELYPIQYLIYTYNYQDDEEESNMRAVSFVPV
jgi:hypothetical protein